MRLHKALFEVFSLISEGFRRLEAILLTTLLFGLMVLGLVQIVLRNVGVALPWADGMMRGMVLWLAMIAGVMAAGQLRHIRINLIDHWLPEGLLVWINRLAFLITAVVCAVMCWFGLQMVGMEASFGAVAFLNVPAWAVQFIVPLGFALMGFRFLFIAISPQLPEHTIATAFDGSGSVADTPAGENNKP